MKDEPNLMLDSDGSARAFRAMADMALALSGTTTPAEVARAIVDEGMKVAQADTCSLYLLDETGNALDLIGHRGIDPVIVDRTRRITAADAPTTFSNLAVGAMTYAETVAQYEVLHPSIARAKAVGPRARAFWSIPLIAEGRPVGLLGMGFYEERRFPPGERALIETLAKQCAQALLRALRLDREQQASAWLSTTLRSIGDAVIATDTAGRVKFMNEVAVKLTGWTEREAHGRPLDEIFSIFSEETRAPCENPVGRVLREGRVIGLANHTVLRSKAGAQIPIADSAAPIFDANGALAGVVLVFRDVTIEKREQARREFLERAGSALASSLDYRATLASAAQLAVPQLADWCGVTLVDPSSGALQEVAVAHADPAKIRWARELGKRYPPNPDAPNGIPQVIRTGKSELYAELPWAMLEAAAQDEEHVRILRELMLESAMVVPLKGHERTLGAMTFIFAQSARRYQKEDLAFAEEFARRAGMAIENALALKEAEEARLSQRHAAEAKLEASEARFQLLVEAVTDYAIYMLDATGHVSTWNAGAQKAKGYEPHEIIGKHFSVFYTPEDRAAGRPERLLETVRREGRVEDESWRVRKDGTRFWANVIMTALRDERGQITGFAKITRDLTARRAAEEKERRLIREQLARTASDTERQRLLTLLNQVPATINFLRGSDLVFEFAHPTTVLAFGRGDLVGKPLLEASPELRQQSQIEHLRRVYATGESYAEHEGPAWFQSKPGNAEAYWNSVFLPVRNATGDIEGVMTFDVEVTESVVARQELERVNRAKDEFLATMSHELRTPLHAITGWATILQRKPLDAEKLERGLQVIERNAKTQARLVSDLLDISRIISGKLQLSVQETEIFPVIVAACDVVRPAAEGKGVRLIADVDPDLGAAVADPDRLQQVVWNLLSNAVRFTPRGGRVTVTGDRLTSAIQIRVADTGAGIAAEHLPHVFERFRQVDSSTTRSHGGLGLGLAIVRHLVEAHGGSVEARSEGLGHGTTFTVKLPIRAVAAYSSETPWKGEGQVEIAAKLEAPTSSSLKDVRVLVVDDDTDSLDVLRIVLESAGARVTTAKGAREAFDAIDAQDGFEIIVSDIGMPEVDGYSFMRSIRARSSIPQVPAIALTAYARAEDAELAKSAGYQEHLTKPVDERRLVNAVKAWYEQARGESVN